MKQTDWNSYYGQPYKTASITRKITTGKLISKIRQFSKGDRPLTIAELGGANSCFVDTFLALLKPARYFVLDNNQLGLNKLKERYPSTDQVAGGLFDLTHDQVPNEKFDVVFSVGLIEHFPPEFTAKVVRRHFDLVKPNGLVIISYPTPTWLYQLTRKLAEFAGLWIFHDERPLSRAEVQAAIPEGFQVLDYELNWPIILTQGIVTIRSPA